VSDDPWDVWEDVEAQFARLARWAPHQRPGAWADADMLPVGRIAQRAERGSERLSRLTLDEQRTMLTLWCVARSPLMLGCDLPSSPPETLDLLTNPDLLAAHRSSINNRELLRDGDLVVWAADSTTADDRFVAVFNTGTAALVRMLPLADLGLIPAGPARDGAGWAGREAWTGAAAGIGQLMGMPALKLELPPHGVHFYRFTRVRTS
jgi:alpha-galactosidase